MKKFEKLKTLIRNKIYAKYTDYLIIKNAPKKIKDSKQFLIDLSSKNKSDGKTLEFTDGFKLECNVIDLGAIAETCITEDYQRYEKLRIHSEDVVFDVGAHIGSFSIYAASKGADVYAFEPNSENYAKLLRNISLNNLSGKVKAFNFGVHNFSGEINFDVSDSNKGGHSMLTNNSTNKAVVPVKTLRDIFTEISVDKVDLLKIDIEGSEYEIFEKFSSVEGSKIKRIVGEYHLLPEKPEWNFNYIQRLLGKYYSDIGCYVPYYFYALNNGKTPVVGDNMSYISHNAEYETTSDLKWCQKHFAEYEAKNELHNQGFEQAAVRASKQNSKHIDIGSGAGWLLLKTAPLFNKVIGVEPSLAAINIAKQLTDEIPNIEYRNSDMMSLSEELKDGQSVFLTTSTVLSHINNNTVAAFLKIIDSAPTGSNLYFGEPYDKNHQQYLWHIRSREWWAKNLPNWELEFATIKTNEYFYGISGKYVGEKNVKTNYKLGLIQKIFWFISGLKSRAKFVVKTILLLLPKK